MTMSSSVPLQRMLATVALAVVAVVANLDIALGQLSLDGSTERQSGAANSKPDAAWELPHDNPGWFEPYRKSAELIDQRQASLQQFVELDLREKSLRLVFAYLSEKTGVPFFINTAELDLLGVDPDAPVTIKAQGNLLEMTNLILQPLDLSIVVRAAGIEVTSLDAADSEPIVCCYDMRLVLASAAEARQLVKAVVNSVDPDAWYQNGGLNGITPVGHVMVVSAPETTHHKIRSLLVRLARLRAADASTSPRERDGS